MQTFSFFTKLSMALLEKLSLSQPCLWHIKLWTMLKQASADVGIVAEKWKNVGFNYKFVVWRGVFINKWSLGLQM